MRRFNRRGETGPLPATQTNRRPVEEDSTYKKGVIQAVKEENRPNTPNPSNLTGIHLPLPSREEMEYFMGLALAEAELAFAEGEVPVGAVVVREGEVIGRGHNQREALKDSTAHAEIIAMRRAAQHIGDWRLVGCILYTTIEPCAMCAGAIVQFRVPLVVYGARDPKAGCVDSVIDLLRRPEFNHRATVIAGIRAEECGEIMRRFFRQLRMK